jgi:membrane protein involved in colicin uptake
MSQDRRAKQLAEREAGKNAPRPAALLEKTKAWLARSDPLAAELAAPERAEAERQRVAEMARRGKMQSLQRESRRYALQVEVGRVFFGLSLGRIDATIRGV